MRNPLGALCAMVVLAGCAGVVVEPAPGPSARSLDIPKGHLPPPGQCRVWYPDRPPGQQPPPGDCGRLRQQVPPGAVLVQG